MESVVSVSPRLANPALWAGRRVLVTGHTGFKGGWLVHWLKRLGAQVHGIALPPDTMPNLFAAGAVERCCASHVLADLRDAAATRCAVVQARPEVVFHLAAQPLVRASYADPVGTYATNVLGTTHLLDACRALPELRAIVIVTSDKCYENREWQWGYRESDALGGHDPYSSSKACAELVTASFRSSFFQESGVGVATARAGNVIGGGDWATGRLVPDIVSAFAGRRPARLRRPDAIRPWQHVLDPLHGYLLLAESLIAENSVFARGWNFGPDADDARTVFQLATRMAELWGPSGSVEIDQDSGGLHEAGRLVLDSSEARARLLWRPRWNLEAALQASVDWYAAFYAGTDVAAITAQQIDQYMKA